MTQSIIDRLEPIQIQTQHRAFAQSRPFLQPLAQQHPVGQFGQRVVVGQERAPGDRAVAFGHVLATGQEPAIRCPAQHDADVAIVQQSLLQLALMPIARLREARMILDQRFRNDSARPQNP